MPKKTDQRRALGFLIVVVVAVVGVYVTVNVLRHDGGPEHVERTTVSAPERISAAWPGVGTYERDWRRAVRTVDEQDVVMLAGPHVVVATDRGLEAYDARSGEPSWHYRELPDEGQKERDMTGFAVTAGVVVATFESARTEHHMVGLDARTGETLWDNGKQWRLTVSGRPSDRPSAAGDAAAGIVTVRKDDDKTYGVDVHTGRVEWRHSDSDVVDGDTCTPAESDDAAAGDGAVLPMAATCEEGDAVVAGIDARSGDRLWTRRIDSTASADATLRTSGPMALLTTTGVESSTDLIGRDGAVQQSFGRVDDANVYSVAGRTVVTYRVQRPDSDDEQEGEETYSHEQTDDDSAYQDMAVVSDRRTGEVEKRFTLRGTVVGGAWAVAGDRLYGVMKTLRFGDDTRLLPSGLAVLDVARGRLDQVPMPHGSPTYRAEGGSTLLTRVLGAVGDRLVTVDQAESLAEPTRLSVLTSYRVADTKRPTELGGVPATDWPDACRLLGKGHGPRVPGAPKRLGGVTLERTSCRDESLSVRVIWVSRTRAEAAALFEDGEDPRLGGDEERYLDGAGATMVRVGRVVVEVDTAPLGPLRSPEPIVRRLRAHQP